MFFSRSVSGQFVIQSAPVVTAAPLVSYLENDTNFIRLDPTLLPISCERIKRLLCRKLEVSESWKGKIFLKLYPTTSADNPIVIDSEQFRDGWQYHVGLPTISHRERYLRAIVTVLLLELANRESRDRFTEVPAWLTEGLSREIWTADEREVILPPPQVSDSGLRITTLLVNARRQNPLEQAHQLLSGAAPLSFQQLSWPVPEQLTGEIGETYRNSAQLFVDCLLNLPGGPACLRSMLEELPRYYNWQFAFLTAFHDSFRQTLDVEKWWSLQLVHFTGRGLTESWPAEQSWQKLDELVRSAVQIRIGTNEVPLHGEIALQTIIRQWPVPRQTTVLESKLRELQMLRPRLNRDLAALADDYCHTIETYLAGLNHHGIVLPFRKQARLRHNSEETLQHLDGLDARRALLAPGDHDPELSPNRRNSQAQVQHAQ